jgi:hypothetical protein
MSMAIGYNALAIIVAACYTLVFGFLVMARRRRAAAVVVPAEARAA